MIDQAAYGKLLELQAQLDPDVYAVIQNVEEFGPRLVCSARKDSRGRGHGNSFWVAFRTNKWFIVTWAPNYYECSPETDMRHLCQECLASSIKPFAQFDQNIVVHFNLTVVEESAFNLM